MAWAALTESCWPTIARMSVPYTSCATWGRCGSPCSATSLAITGSAAASAAASGVKCCPSTLPRGNVPSGSRTTGALFGEDGCRPLRSGTYGPRGDAFRAPGSVSSPIGGTHGARSTLKPPHVCKCDGHDRGVHRPRRDRLRGDPPAAEQRGALPAAHARGLELQARSRGGHAVPGAVELPDGGADQRGDAGDSPVGTGGGRRVERGECGPAERRVR